jgi:hypothetical protein
MRRSSIFLVAIAFVSFAACAQGTNSEGDNTGDDTGPSPDANDDLPIDARPPIDASTPIDANIPIDSSVPIDASTPIDAGTGPFCTSHSQCTVPGECCFSLNPPDPGFCVAGTQVGDYCFPE